jgi:hypothetical protein
MRDAIHTVSIRVEESSAIEMIGPYLATSAQCPLCKGVNRFTFQESRASAVIPVVVCRHIRARIIDDDGVNHFEFA